MPKARHSWAEATDEQIKTIETQTGEFHEQGREPATRANLNRHRASFEGLTRRRGHAPWPANPEDVAVWLVAECVRLESVASIDQMHSAVRTGQREYCSVEWTKPEEAFMAMVKRGLRKRYRAPTQRKRPITLAVLADMVRGVDMEELPNLQHTAMAFLAHDACLRTKELLALRWDDIEWFLNREGEPTAFEVTIRVSKARYTEAAEKLRVNRYQLGGVPLCGVTALWFYMNDAEVRGRAADMESFLFPNLRKGKAKAAEPRDDFIKWVRERLKACGYESKAYAGHSFRAGGCTDMYKGNAPERVARWLGRWRAREAYLIYIRLEPGQQAADVSSAFSRAYDGALADALQLSKDSAARYASAYDAEFRSE